MRLSSPSRSKFFSISAYRLFSSSAFSVANLSSSALISSSVGPPLALGSFLASSFLAAGGAFPFFGSTSAGLFASSFLALIFA